MVLSLGSNLTSDPSLRAMSQFSGRIGLSMQRISTGRKINLAADNPSGTGVSLTLSSQLRRYQAIKDGIANASGLVQVQIGALSDIQRLLTRAEVLSINYKSPFRLQYQDPPKPKSSGNSLQNGNPNAGNPNFGNSGSSSDFESDTDSSSSFFSSEDFGPSLQTKLIDNLEWSSFSKDGSSNPTGVRATMKNLVKSAFNSFRLFSDRDDELLKFYTNIENSSFVVVSRPGLEKSLNSLRNLTEIDDFTQDVNVFDTTVKQAKSEVEGLITTKGSDLQLLQDFVDQLAARTSSTERNLSRLQDTDLAAEAVYKTRSIIGYLASTAMQAQANVRRDMALKLIVS
jgi:flagellin-like hook-associated protein FlgL